jgi:Flp pilus assembly protein TadD
VTTVERARDRATDQARGLDGGPLRKEIEHDLAVARLLQGKWAEAQDLLLGVLGLTELPKPQATAAPDNGGDDDGSAAPAGPRLAQEFDPWKARAHVNLGVAAMRNEQHEAARECFALGAALDPTSAEPWISLGALEEKVGDPYAAHQAYRQALVIDPTDASARYTLGQLLFRAGKLDEAEKELEEAIRHDPGLADALLLLGHVALRTQRDQAAARYFARAAEFLPDDGDLHAARGVALLRSGDLAGADAAFTRALQVNGKNLTAQEGQAWIEYARARGKREPEGQALAQMQQLASDWSKQAQDLIQLQREKHQWVDFFDRREGKKVGNRWEHELTNGPLVQLRDGRAVLSGPVKKNPTEPAVELVRQTDRALFVSVEATLWVDASKSHAARLVIMARRKNDEVQDALTFGRNAEGQVALGHYDPAEKRWKDIATYGAWPAPAGDGGGVRLGLERLMDGRRFVDRYRLTVNGEVVAAELEVPFRAAGDLWVGVHGAANLNQPIDITIDDVRIVEKRSK